MTLNCDFLIVGAGVAGLRAAIGLAHAGRVLVLTKDQLQESSSEYAQGGIAAAMAEDDKVELHYEDTLMAGDGLCDEAAVRRLVSDAPTVVEELLEWGAEFDRDGGRLMFGREGAHSRNRILHAHGDSTGKEIAKTLYRKAAALPNVQFRSFAAMTDLLTSAGGVCLGANVFDQHAQKTIAIQARAVLLATGGLGRVFLETTNPDVATGDGVAAAYRAGAEVADIEFVQFHPTALYLPGVPRFLISEALRGEGAYLRNKDGDRFMERYHPLLELAPRDVVSRSIVAEMRRTGGAVTIDMTHRGSRWLRSRFPRIYETCLRFGIDLGLHRAPVHPAAHYAMGGVRTDLQGRTTVPQLFAAGEAACNGVHGANRLASNSLLEGLVYGARAATAMRESPTPAAARAVGRRVVFPTLPEAGLRRLAWEHCGVLRTGEGLAQASRSLAAMSLVPKALKFRQDFETRSIYLVLRLMAQAAAAREESRGGHHRLDFPEKSEAFRKHSVLRKDHAVEFCAHLQS